MKIGDKYSPSHSEKNTLKALAVSSNAEDAFVNLCCQLIIRGYQKVVKSKKIDLNWDEEDISDFLAEQIESCCREGEYPYHIDTDSRDRAESVDGINIKGKKRKRYDIKFSYFSDPRTENAFGIEAKLLIENDTPPKTSTTLIEAYISVKGMRKFIEGVYSKRGCMIGYIIEGSPKAIVQKINERMKADTFYNKAKILTPQKAIEMYSHHYESEHTNLSYPLKHLMLDFTKK